MFEQAHNYNWIDYTCRFGINSLVMIGLFYALYFFAKDLIKGYWGDRLLNILGILGCIFFIIDFGWFEIFGHMLY